LEYCDSLDYLRFVNSKLTQDAVIRNLEIIGEAASKLTKEFIRQYSDLPVKQARGLRNLLVHRYDYVDVDEVWRVIDKDLIPLRKVLQKILKATK